MKNLKTFEEFVNENYSVNEANVPKNYMKGGFHYIAIVDEDDALNPKFRKMKKQLIAVYGGLKYVYSVKKGKTLEKVLDPRLPISPISKMIYDVDSGKFYSVSNKKELRKETELNYPFINTKLSDVEQDFKVAATGHVNDYEKIGAEIKKVSESFDEPGYTPHKLKNSRLVMKTRDELYYMQRHQLEKLLDQVNKVKHKLEDKYNREQEGHNRFSVTDSLSADLTYLRSYAKIINYFL